PECLGSDRRVPAAEPAVGTGIPVLRRRRTRGEFLLRPLTCPRGSFPFLPSPLMGEGLGVRVFGVRMLFAGDGGSPPQPLPFPRKGGREKKSGAASSPRATGCLPASATSAT